MKNLTKEPVSGFAEVLASLRETGRLMKENERILKEQFAESDRQRQENERLLKEQFAESNRQRQENERILNEKFAETDRQIQATDRQMKETDQRIDRRMKNLEDRVGAWGNNQGLFAEEYFSNSFEQGKQNFFGERFDRIVKNAKGFRDKFEDEYDILLINGKSIGIVEVKFKAHERDIPKVLRKAETFRVNFPEYAHHQVYLGLATMVFYPELEEGCIHQGIAIVKQVGDTVVIHDEHLKVF